MKSKEKRKYQLGWHSGYNSKNGTTPNLRFKMGYKLAIKEFLEQIEYMRNIGEICLIQNEYEKIKKFAKEKIGGKR